MDEVLLLVIPNEKYKQQAINLIKEVDKTDLNPKIRFSGFNFNPNKNVNERRYWIDN